MTLVHDEYNVHIIRQSRRSIHIAKVESVGKFKLVPEMYALL